MQKFIQFVIVLSLCSCQQITCPFYDLKSIKENCGGCGICQQLQETDETNYCSWNFTNYFHGTLACQIVDQCVEEGHDVCGQFPCFPMLGTFRCECDSDRIGRTCENEAVPGSTWQDYAVVQDVVFPPVFAYDHFATISVFINRMGKQLGLLISTYYESILFSGDMCKKVDVQAYCTKWYKDYPTVCENNPNINSDVECVFTIHIYSPMEVVTHADDILQYINSVEGNEEKIVGLKTPFRILLFNLNGFEDNTPVFFRWYHMLSIDRSPDAPAGGCSPFLYLYNVGEFNRTRSVFTRRDEIIISSSYQLHCDQADSIVQVFKLWKVTINHDELYDAPFQEIYNKKNLYYNPFSLDIGSYKLKLLLTAWSGINKSFRFTYGFFQVISLELQPEILGGEQICAFYDAKFLKLDGSLTYDPDLSPEKQRGSMEFYWSCDKKIKMCEKRRSDYTVTYKGPFMNNETYNFLLMVISKHDRRRIANTTQSVFMTPSKQGSLSIVCKKNCGSSILKSDPGEVIYLEAITGEDSFNTDVEWSYSSSSDESVKPLEDIRQKNTPSYVLIILKSKLSEDKVYTFQAEITNTETLCPVKFVIKTAKKADSFTCIAFNKYNGSRLSKKIVTGELEVKCDIPNYATIPPIYSFYDKYPESNEEGRLVAVGRSNSTLIQVTRGKIVVEVTNEHGVTGTTEILIDLLDMNDYTRPILNKLDNLKKSGSTSDLAYKINEMSIILDLITYKNHTLTPKNVTSIMDLMLEYSSTFTIKDISDLKILANLIGNIACSNFSLGSHFTIRNINHLGMTVEKLSLKLLNEVKSNRSESNFLTIGGVHNLCKIIFCICNRIYNSSNILLMRQNQISPKDHALYRETSSNLVGSVRRIMLCLALKNLPYESPVEMKEVHIQIWTKEDTILSFATDGAVPSVVVTEELAKYIKVDSKFFIIQVADYDGDPYKYNQDIVINTNAIDLVIRFKKENSEPSIEIENPVGIKLKHFQFKKNVVSGSVQQPDHKNLLENKNYESQDVVDLRVAVYRLRIPQTGRLDLNFLNLKEGQTFKVIALLNMRPDYKYLMDQGKVIDRDHSFFTTTLVDAYSYDVYDLYYIGIIPGENKDVPPGHFLNYTFDISSEHCVGWKIYEWDTYKCSINSTMSQHLNCDCGYLSTFAGSSRVPIMKLDPFKDVKLILNPQSNPFVVALILSLLAMFLLLLIWAVWRDRKDKYVGCAIYLEDNFSGDEFAYLVAVYTGNKFFSGTTSTVGLQIEGDGSCSRPHILESPFSRTLQRGDDNWFIVFAPDYLGNLEMIHLWMNYSGKHPEWYCYKVVVFDLYSKKEYLFLVDSWITLRGEDFIERYQKVAKPEEVIGHVTYNDNLIYGLRETHPLASMLYRHPRSKVTRAQRVVIAFTGLAVLMFTTCLFYNYFIGPIEDSSEYKIEQQELAIGLFALFVTFVIINILASGFRKTIAPKLFDSSEPALEDSDFLSQASTESGRSVANRRKKFFLRFFEAILKSIGKPKRFKPVLLDKQLLTFVYPKKLVFFRVVIWTICLAFIILCLLLSGFLSIKLGKYKSLKWLTCVVISLILLLFIVVPVKVFVVAALSRPFSKRFYKVSCFKINHYLLVKYRAWYAKNNQKILSKVIELRSQSVYVSLSYKQFLKKLHKQRMEDAVWSLLDLLVTTLLVVLMFFQNDTLWTTKYYWNNKQLTSLLKKGYGEEGIQFYKLKDMSLYSVFLEDFVLPLVYQTIWYNELVIEENNSTEDSGYVFGGTSKLFGLPRLRQLRMRPDKCTKPLLEGLPPQCVVALTKDTEDTDIYGEGWSSKNTPEKVFKLAPWSYLNTSESYESTLYGYSRLVYQGGGYVTDLTMREEKSEDILLYLRKNHWIDNFTSVVVFELTMYNAFTGTFSWLVSLTENLRMGMLLNKVYVMSVSYGYIFSVFDVLLLAFLLIFTSARVLYLINRNGIDKLCNNFWNIIEIMAILSAICAAVLFLKNLALKSKYLNTFDSDTRDHYFEFYHMVRYLFEFKIVVIFLLILLAVRFLKCWGFSKTFNLYFHTLFSEWMQLVWIFSYLVLLLHVHWKVVSYLINNFLLLRSNFVIVNKLDFKQVVKSCQDVKCKINPFLLCLVAYIAGLFVVLYFFATYRIVKRKYTEKEYLNFCTIFCKSPETDTLDSFNGDKTMKSVSL